MGNPHIPKLWGKGKQQRRCTISECVKRTLPCSVLTPALTVREGAAYELFLIMLHMIQDVAPGKGLTVRGGHARQASSLLFLPSSYPYEPAGHGVHWVPSFVS